jgi:hypothetical protein
MTNRTATFALTLALAALPLAARAQEDPAGHAAHATHTIVLDGSDVRPSTTNMSHTDVIDFLNYSAHPVRVEFTDPKDLKDKIRCGLVGHAAKTHPPDWALFSWSDDKLVATIPPGRFASVCSLASGTYAFTAIRQGAGAHAPAGAGVLPAKAQIVVD